MNNTYIYIHRERERERDIDTGVHRPAQIPRGAGEVHPHRRGWAVCISGGHKGGFSKGGLSNCVL